MKRKIPDELRNFLLEIFKINPKKRIKWSQIMKHKYLGYN
jgi:hypothetical protein